MSPDELYRVLTLPPAELKARIQSGAIDLRSLTKWQVDIVKSILSFSKALERPDIHPDALLAEVIERFPAWEEGRAMVRSVSLVM